MVSFGFFRPSHPRQVIGSILAAFLGTCLLVNNSAASDFASCFAASYSDSASAVCRFQKGPIGRLAAYENYDFKASDQGMRNFFATLRLFGKRYACEYAMSTYGPRGSVRAGLLRD